MKMHVVCLRRIQGLHGEQARGHAPPGSVLTDGAGHQTPGAHPPPPLCEVTSVATLIVRSGAEVYAFKKYFLFS